MQAKEVRRASDKLMLRRYDKEGYIVIPRKFRNLFNNRIKILFDPQENLLALQPSNDKDDYETSHWRIWCTSFFKKYNIPEQEVQAFWDELNGYLIAKIRREKI